MVCCSSLAQPTRRQSTKGADHGRDCNDRLHPQLDAGAQLEASASATALRCLKPARSRPAEQVGPCLLTEMTQLTMQTVFWYVDDPERTRISGGRKLDTVSTNPLSRSVRCARIWLVFSDRLPASHRDVDIERTNFDREARPSHSLGGDQRLPLPQEV